MSSRKTRIFGSCAAAAILLLAPLAGKMTIANGAPRAGEQATKAESATTATTTEKDQTDLSVTVYNSNLALVRDVRQIDLQSGVFPLRFEDIAASINPATVHFRSLTDPAELNVVEQNYEYDLLDPQKLLAEVRGPRSHARAARNGFGLDEMGGDEGPAARRQRLARVEDRR